jgi:hypothetical protein
MLYPYVSCSMVMNCIFTVLDMSFNTSCYYGAMHEAVEGGVFLCLIVMTQICYAMSGVYFYLLSAEEKNRKKLSFSDLCCNRFCETKE